MTPEDDVLKKAHDKLVVEAGKATARAAWDGLRRAVSGLADDFIGFAEKELKDAEGARGIQAQTEVEPGKPPDPVPAVEPAPVPEPPHVDEKARAREELEKIKAGAPLPVVEIPKPVEVGPTGARKERLEREAKAREELEAMKAKMGQKGEEPEKKTL